MYRTDFWILWEKARVGCFKRTASKYVYYLGWNRSPAQVGLKKKKERCCCCCSVTKLCLTPCDPWMLGFPVLHHLPDFAQTHVHWVNDTIQLSHTLSPPSPLALNTIKHQGLSQWVSSSHQVDKVLDLHLQHQSFQRIFRVDLL